MIVQTWDEFFKVLILGYDSANSLREHVKKFIETENYNPGNYIKDSIKNYNNSLQYDADMESYKEPINVDIFVTGIGRTNTYGTGKLNDMSFKYNMSRDAELAGVELYSQYLAEELRLATSSTSPVLLREEDEDEEEDDD